MKITTLFLLVTMTIPTLSFANQCIERTQFTESLNKFETAMLSIGDRFAENVLTTSLGYDRRAERVHQFQAAVLELKEEQHAEELFSFEKIYELRRKMQRAKIALGNSLANEQINSEVADALSFSWEHILADHNHQENPVNEICPADSDSAEGEQETAQAAEGESDPPSTEPSAAGAEESASAEGCIEGEVFSQAWRNFRRSFERVKSDLSPPTYLVPGTMDVRTPREERLHRQALDNMRYAVEAYLHRMSSSSQELPQLPENAGQLDEATLRINLSQLEVIEEGQRQELQGSNMRGHLQRAREALEAFSRSQVARRRRIESYQNIQQRVVQLEGILNDSSNQYSYNKVIEVRRRLQALKNDVREGDIDNTDTARFNTAMSYSFQNILQDGQGNQRNYPGQTGRCTADINPAPQSGQSGGSDET